MSGATATLRANALKTTNGFWWTNLSSTDDATAAAFYAELFGWSYDEMPIGEGMVHRNARIDGHLVAGIDPMMPGSEMPSAWTSFVFVEDIGTSVARARELGATIVMEPMDVMGEGHMAVAMDPAGAAFGFWQPGRHTGADAVNQPGAFSWVELATDDLDGARRFYGELFGWEFERQDAPGGMEYWMATLDGRPFAGLMNKPAEMAQMPSSWAVYFGVADVEASRAVVESRGGTIAFGPTRMGPGIGIGVVDPTGGYSVAFQLDEWPAD